MAKWSISGHNCFHRCQRQYFFRNIMAHHNAKKDPRRREAYLIKQLSSLSAWKGRLVHLALEKYFVPTLQNGNIISRDELTSRTLELAEQQLEFSQQRKYRQHGTTKTKVGDIFLALKAHEPEFDLDKQQVQEVFEDIETCYQNLYSHSRFMNFISEQADWYQTEFRLSFQFNNTTIVGQPDLLIGYGEGKICVIDWKTGRSTGSNYSRQLYLYGLAVIRNQKWLDYQLQDLLLVEANLLQNKFIKYTIDESQELEIEDFLDRSISKIKAVTGDRKYNLNDLKDYAYANSLSSCQHCNFKALCQSIS